jgi:outer membrane protein OmpA-like peptidoglycan-associated protein
MSDPNDIFEQESPVDPEDHWIALSDLMTGLMMIFMLIAIAFMMKVEQESAKVKQVTVMYQEVKTELYQDLMNEFKKDLPVWDAEITPDLSVRFRNPDILFDTGKDQLKPRFQEILRDFFPRYLKIVTSDKYEGTIQDIRIEGHTSSLWAAPIPKEEVYFKNMELSQSRTRSALRFVMELPAVEDKTTWLKKHVTANGLSSSHPILNKDGTEDTDRSQRVEFHIRTDAEGWMSTIGESLK